MFKLFRLVKHISDLQKELFSWLWTRQNRHNIFFYLFPMLHFPIQIHFSYWCKWACVVPAGDNIGNNEFHFHYQSNHKHYMTPGSILVRNNRCSFHGFGQIVSQSPNTLKYFDLIFRIDESCVELKFRSRLCLGLMRKNTWSLIRNIIVRSCWNQNIKWFIMVYLLKII